MKSEDATRILLNRKKTTAKLRKQCARARETVMQSATPIYKEVDTDEFGNEQTEYFSSKPSELTSEQRTAAALRRATLAQLRKWFRRSVIHESACRGVVARTKIDRLKAKFTIFADQHAGHKNALFAELSRRDKNAKSIFPDGNVN